MLTDDIRLQRIEDEYMSVRRAQDNAFDRFNGLGDLLERLVEQVTANSAAIEANRDEILAVRQAVAENSQMLADIIDHLEVPRKRVGFLRD